MQVAVEDPKTGETVEFPCQRWFSTRDDDGQITRELIRADVLVVVDEKTSPPTGKKYENKNETIYLILRYLYLSNMYIRRSCIREQHCDVFPFIIRS